jgi:hypothetical protein
MQGCSHKGGLFSLETDSHAIVRLIKVKISIDTNEAY